MNLEEELASLLTESNKVKDKESYNEQVGEFIEKLNISRSKVRVVIQ